MDEQFLKVLHSIEEITDTTPLRDVAKQLPKQIYSIIQSQEQTTRISAELTDQLVFDVAKTYYYSIIECLCKLIKSIQQGQRTALVSLAKMIQDQRDEIEGYQALLKLPEEMRQLQCEMEKLKKHVNIHLERTDKKTSITSVTISEIRSQIHRLETTIEGNFEHILELTNHHGCFLVILFKYMPRKMIPYFVKSLRSKCLLTNISSKMKTQLQVDSPRRAGQYTPKVESNRTIHPSGG